MPQGFEPLHVATTLIRSAPMSICTRVARRQDSTLQQAPGPSSAPSRIWCPAVMMRGPVRRPSRIPSRNAKICQPSAPTFRTVVNPASSVFLALSIAFTMK